MEARQPARNLWPRPQAAVGGRRLDPLLERSQRRRRENGGLRAVVDALVAEGLGAAFIVASDQRAHPPRRERQQLCHLLDLVSAGHQPQRMKMALGVRIGRRLIARLKLNAAQLRMDRRHDRAPAES
jgi:formylmethanofuran dehydrogenase subunit B